MEVPKASNQGQLDQGKDQLQKEHCGVHVKSLLKKAAHVTFKLRLAGKKMKPAGKQEVKEKQEGHVCGPRGDFEHFH